MRGFVGLFAALVLFSAAGCSQSDRTSEIAIALQQTLSSQTIATPTPIGSALQHVVAGNPPTPLAGVWTDVRAFYSGRQNEPAWVTGSSLSKAEAALHVLGNAPAHGFDAADYDETSLTTDLAALKNGLGDQSDRIERLAELDVRITTALLAVGRDVALGRTAPTSIDKSWKARRKAPDFVALLNRAADGNPATWLDDVRPPHPEYAALQQAAIELRQQKDHGGWPKVAGTFKSGESDPSVVVLRARLSASGELSGTAATSQSPDYDANVEAAVRSFQERHAIKATGVADAATVAAMNVPVEDRIAQIAANLERWRWMPEDLGARHFLVNIPSFVLLARENGKTVMDMRVVVGKPGGHETPIFSGDMSNVVFSPYWNVPDSIAEGETAPSAARDPGFLQRNNMEVFRGNVPVKEEDVDWSNPAELKKLSFRQRPGGGNALGHVKFLFPNPFNVYLHDTPSVALFSRTNRALSHGCVRVAEPEKLASYVLRSDSEWDQPRIEKAMNSGVERFVKLTETIPVHIVYFTVWPEADGIRYEPDVYGYDAKQMMEAAQPN